MNTSKYSVTERKAAKRATRNPVYKALQVRATNTTAELHEANRRIKALEKDLVDANLSISTKTDALTAAEGTIKSLEAFLSSEGYIKADVEQAKKNKREQAKAG